MRLIHRANVYTETQATGAYDVVAKENLRCRSVHIGSDVPFEQRRAAGEQRHLLFDREYLMPEDCEILIAGTRYRPVDETFKTVTGTNGRTKLRAVDIVEVEA